MMFQVNLKSGIPVYLQLVDQVKAAAASGVLKPGDTLPSIRPLAEELRINRNTVAKAYSELESQGIVETVTGKGCFISDNHSPLKKEIRQKMLNEVIDAAIIQAHHLQIRNEEFLGAVEKRLQAFAEKKSLSAEKSNLKKEPV